MSSTKKTKPSYKALDSKSETGRRFTCWFNHGWDFIEKTETSWTNIDFYPLSRREIWNRHQDPSIILGLRFGNTTRFLALDIDIPSPYHPANDPTAIAKIKAALEEVGLCRHVLIQSSESGGIHLFTPLTAAVPTFKAACVLKAALESAGLEIEKGKLEIFPNPKRYSNNGEPSRYNGLRLPLQPGSGSYLLSDDFNPVSERVEDFLDQMERAAAGQDLKTFRARLNPAYEKYKAGLRRHKNNDSEGATAWKRDLEKTLSEGWTNYGQTNALLIEFVAYTIVFLRLQGRELRERVKQQVINAPGYQQYCRHQHEIDRRIEQICYHTERNRYYLPYCNHPERDSTFGETYHPSDRPLEKPTSKQEDTRKRLIETVAYLEERGILPNGITARKALIQKTAKELHGKAFSIGTLSHRDYLPYWHPKHRDETRREPGEEEASPAPLEIAPETPEPLPDEGSYRSEVAPPEILESESSETLTGQALVSIAPLYEVFVCDLTAQPETECSVSESLVSSSEISASSVSEISVSSSEISASSVPVFPVFPDLPDLPDLLDLPDLSDLPDLPDLPDQIEPPSPNSDLSSQEVSSDEREESENPILNPESSSPRKRKHRWEKLTLVERLEKWKARKIPLVYTGSTASQLIETREVKRSRLHSIYQGETVLISDLNHTSFWFHPDDEENLRIYVKPIDRVKEWKTGIVVLAKHLQPLDS